MTELDKILGPRGRKPLKINETTQNVLLKVAESDMALSRYSIANTLDRSYSRVYEAAAKLAQYEYVRIIGNGDKLELTLKGLLLTLYIYQKRNDGKRFTSVLKRNAALLPPPLDHWSRFAKAGIEDVMIFKLKDILDPLATTFATTDSFVREQLGKPYFWYGESKKWLQAIRKDAELKALCLKVIEESETELLSGLRHVREIKNTLSG